MDVEMLKTNVEVIIKMYSNIVPVFFWFGMLIGGALGVVVTIVVKMGIDVYRVRKGVEASEK